MLPQLPDYFINLEYGPCSASFYGNIWAYCTKSSLKLGGVHKLYLQNEVGKCFCLLVLSFLIFPFLIGISSFSFSNSKFSVSYFKNLLLARGHGTEAFRSCFLIRNILLQRDLAFIFDVLFYYKHEQFQK